MALPRPPLLGAGLSWHPGGQTIRWYKGDEATGWGRVHVCLGQPMLSHICGVTLIEAVQRCQGWQQTPASALTALHLYLGVTVPRAYFGRWT